MTAGAPPFRVLLHQDEIHRRTRELARRIARDLALPDLLLVAVIDGARRFARLLQQHLPGHPTVHEIRASSYGQDTASSGAVQIAGLLPEGCAGRTLLLVEDIVDTGRTIAALRTHFLGQGARACRVVTLLSKPARRLVDAPVDYVGFEIPDEFVIGCGMDVAGRYRDLPDVVVYDPEVERRSAPAAAVQKPSSASSAGDGSTDSTTHST